MAFVILSGLRRCGKVFSEKVKKSLVSFFPQAYCAAPSPLRRFSDKAFPMKTFAPIASYPAPRLECRGMDALRPANRFFGTDAGFSPD